MAGELLDKPHAVIVDMGAGDGQMRRYCIDSMASISVGYPFESQHWTGLDMSRSQELTRAGYQEIIECDFNRTLPLKSGSVNLLVCIHVMEHLLCPEFTMAEIARVLAPGGVFCGGSPTAPSIVSYFLHRRLRRKMRNGTVGPNGHINSLCPDDWKRLVRGSGLTLDFLSGSHFMRLSGSILEDSKAWVKCNLFFGGIAPSLGSEVYLLARKNLQMNASQEID